MTSKFDLENYSEVELGELIKGSSQETENIAR